MRTVFVGAVESSRAALEALLGAGMPPDLIVTLPPESAGRHSDFVDLTTLARKARIAVFHAADVNAETTLDAIKAREPDLCLVIGWSQICRAPFRAVARLGSLGFHPAPLPKFRGRAVIPWTILSNEPVSGSTLFWLDEGVDSGDILLQRTFDVDPHETARSLYSKHIDALKEMLPEALSQVRSGTVLQKTQDHAQASYCAKRLPEDGIINWAAPADTVLRLIRAVSDPYPGAFTYCEGEKLVIDAAAPFPRSHQFIGLTGQVQCHTDEGFAVRCGDGLCIDVQAWRWRSERRPKVHSKLYQGEGKCP